MRSVTVIVACIAASCGGSGGGDDGPGGDGGMSVDGPPAGTPLDQRLTVKTVTAVAGVMAGDSNWRIWGQSSLRVAPVYTVPYGDCGTLIGYTTGTSAPTARVARLDANDVLVTTYDLGAFELRGLAAEIGSLAPVQGGSKLVFNAHQAPATMGQGSYSPSTMNQDIGLATIGPNGAAVGDVVWLTTTPGNEQNSSIAAWHPAGDTAEQYLIGWSEGTSARTYKLGRFAADGSVLEAPIDVTAMAKWGERDDPFREHTNHDVVWAWFDAAGSTMLKVARVSSGQSAQCASF